MAVIVIKTLMRRIPKCCKDCTFYTSSTLTQNYGKHCRAIGGYPIGKDLKTINVIKETAPWCPLKEIDPAPKSVPEKTTEQPLIPGQTRGHNNPNNSPRVRTRASSICWNCVNSIPNPEKKTGCAWSIFKRPVEGWVAEETQLYEMTSYNVKSCPKFKKG